MLRNVTFDTAEWNEMLFMFFIHFKNKGDILEDYPEDGLIKLVAHYIKEICLKFWKLKSTKSITSLRLKLSL